MSGGSYDYLYAKDASELDPDHTELLSMLGRLRDLGYADAAVAHTEKIQTRLRAARAEINDLIVVIGPVWKAVEWADSCDTTQKDLRDAVIQFEASQLNS